MPISLKQSHKLAYPYAKAVFALALQHKQLNMWQETLRLATQVVVLGNKQGLFVDPQINFEDKLSFFTEINQFFPPLSGLLHLLAERKRLMLLPMIATIYEQLVLVQEGGLRVRVVTASTLDVTSGERLEAALTKRYAKKIILECSCDLALIGGMVVYVQDQIFDGSLRSVVQRLYKECGSNI